MTVGFIEARDEMFSMFKTTWDADAGAIAGAIPLTLYQGVSERTTGPEHNYWVRLSTVTSQERQRRFPSNPNQRTNTVDGQLFVELFGPRSVATAWNVLQQLAVLARNVYKFQRSVPSGAVLFRRTRIEEQPPEEKLYRINVVCEYEFDELILLSA